MTSQPFEASEFHVQNWPFLDGLRGVALLIVLGLHARLPFLAGGIYGVDIFFVMSGFLITVLLMDEWHRTQGIKLRAFYIRRALRLVPALLAMAAICCVYAFVYLDPASATSVYSGAKYAVIYFTNWASVLGWVGLTIFSATWSLAIEEQFYLLWPIILIVLLRLRCSTKTKTLLIAGGAMSSMLWRLYLAHRDGFTVRELVGIDARADGLLLGAALGAALYWGL